METPRDRLSPYKDVFRNIPGDVETYRPTKMAADVECAIEVAETLLGLTVAVNDMANRSTTVLNNLITKIDEATKQSAASAQESGKLAAESAKLSGKLNSLTKWIMAATIAAAFAAVVQAGVAVYGAWHPQEAVIRLETPSPAAPPVQKQ